MADEKPKEKGGRKGPWRRLGRWLARGGLALAALLGVLVLLVLILRFVNPPANLYQLSERWRLGEIRQDWVRLSDLPPHVPLSAAAAEDANFCVHWGFDFDAIRTALAETRRRGASTISQQTAKNVFLWHGRSWLRKGLEAGFTLLIEGIWPKRRIMEVYLNVAEFDEGVFGIGAAAQRYFGVSATALTAAQAARLMTVLPDPKGRSAASPGPAMQRRAAQIAEGARTLDADGRGGCLIG